MTVSVRIPAHLRCLSNGAPFVAVNGRSVREVLYDLTRIHPEFDERLFDGAGALRSYVNLFVADVDIRFTGGLDTPVSEGQTVSILAAATG